MTGTATQELEGLDPPMEDAPYPAGLSPEELRRVRTLLCGTSPEVLGRQPSLRPFRSECKPPKRNALPVSKWVRKALPAAVLSAPEDYPYKLQ